MKKIEGKFNYIEATEDEIIDHHNKGLTHVNGFWLDI
jgi:hypothetical protein